MIYYKSKTGEVYAHKTEAERQEWGAPDLVAMTPTEVDAHLNPKPTTEQLANTARSTRPTHRISRWRIERHSDELALGSEPTEPLEPLLQYAQDCATYHSKQGFPESVEWPQCP